jgi:hypothetical protein
MPLDTTGKRRSSVGLLQPWQPNIPSPLESPGTIDQADQQQMTWSYSGILAIPEVILPAAVVIFGTWAVEPVLWGLWSADVFLAGLWERVALFEGTWSVETPITGTWDSEPVVTATGAVQPADALVDT